MSSLTEKSDDERPGRDSEQTPLRVAWVAAEGTLERLSRIIEPLSIGLMDELIDVIGVCPDGADASCLPSPPMKIHRYLPLRWWRIGDGCIAGVSEKLRADKPSLVHALDGDSLKYARRLARRLGVPYAVSSYSLWDHRRLGTLRDRCAGVLAASEPIQRNLLRHRTASPEKIHLVRPGVYQMPHATCFTEDGRTTAIVAGGSMERFRDLSVLLECFAELHLRNYDCAFFIIGGGRIQRRLRKRVEELSLREVLTFADARPVSRLPGIFKAADIYIAVHSSHSLDTESLLAVSAGVPVLTSGSEASDFLVDGRTAMSFSLRDASGLTMKLAALLDDTDAARSLAESALSYLREYYQASRMVSDVARIYRGACG